MNLLFAVLCASCFSSLIIALPKFNKIRRIYNSDVIDNLTISDHDLVSSDWTFMYDIKREDIYVARTIISYKDIFFFNFINFTWFLLFRNKIKNKYIIEKW